MASLHCFYVFPIPYVFDDGANRQKELTENIRERAEAPMTMNKIGTRRNETSERAEAPMTMNKIGTRRNETSERAEAPMTMNKIGTDDEQDRNGR